MRFTVPSVLSLLTLSAASNLPEPQQIFSNPPNSQDASYRIPTIHESAVQARRILHLESLGTLSTIFPTSPSHALENRPSDVGGTPIGLMDYYGDCEPSTGNPTILAITIATSFKNVAAGSNITLSLRWHPPDAHKKFYSAAALPRFSLIGHLEDIPFQEQLTLPVCFVKYHPDAAAWLPGNPIHTSKWVRLVVEQVYWIGGFGDRAYIGWIPVEQWRNVTKEEIEEIRLPGEESSAWGGVWEWFGMGKAKEAGVIEL